MKKNSFFAYISRMKYIDRWALMRNTDKENLEEHSYRVAVIAHALAVIGNTYFGRAYDQNLVAAAGLFHDCGETVTGDMPTPVKYYNPEIRDAYKRVESVANEKLLASLPAELRPSYEPLFGVTDTEVRALVKAADRLSAYIKCVEEAKAGNAEFDSAADSIMESIMHMKMPEANYFVEHFLPLYRLTLDELE